MKILRFYNALKAVILDELSQKAFRNNQTELGYSLQEKANRYWQNSRY